MNRETVNEEELLQLILQTLDHPEPHYDKRMFSRVIRYLLKENDKLKQELEGVDKSLVDKIYEAVSEAFK